MRAPRLLTVSQTQPLCAFCAFRIYGEIAPLSPARLAVTRRKLSTTATVSQTSEAVQSTPPQNESAFRGGFGAAGSDAYSSLTPAERREKERKQELRAQEEANARAKEAEARAKREEAQAKQTEAREKWATKSLFNSQRNPVHRPAQAPTIRTRRVEPGHDDSDKRISSDLFGSSSSPVHRPAGTPTNRIGASHHIDRNRSGKVDLTPRRTRDEFTSKTLFGQQNEQLAQQARVHAVQHADNATDRASSAAPNTSDGRSGQMPATRGVTTPRTTQSQVASRAAAPPPKLEPTAMPSLGPRNTDSAAKASVSGWGARPGERQPLVYGAGMPREPETAEKAHYVPHSVATDPSPFQSGGTPGESRPFSHGEEIPQDWGNVRQAQAQYPEPSSSPSLPPLPKSQNSRWMLQSDTTDFLNHISGKPSSRGAAPARAKTHRASAFELDDFFAATGGDMSGNQKQTKQWQHLRASGPPVTESASASSDVRPQIAPDMLTDTRRQMAPKAQNQPKSPFDDFESIERSFSAHQRQRRPGPPPATNFKAPPPAAQWRAPPAAFWNAPQPTARRAPGVARKNAIDSSSAAAERVPSGAEPVGQHRSTSAEQQEALPERTQRRGRASFWNEEAPEPVGYDKKKSKRPNERRSARQEEEDDEGEAIREAKAARKAARQAERDQRLRESNQASIDAKGVPINLPEFVNVSNLAQLLGVRYEAFVDRLEQLGYDDIYPGQILNSEVSGMIAMEFNYDPQFEQTTDAALVDDERDLKAMPEMDKTYLMSRPPVVTIMGHVDHGKTTILDYLRKSSVAAGEAGGITQHIGAFSVPLAASGKTITFLDTPGHAAFLAMRQRGANVTDIVVLVVAADDSVKPQTLEALRHARAANVPIIVAINKVDKEEADVQKVKADLGRHGIEIEEYGGDVPAIAVSGKTGKGLDDLEEAIVTLGEILDHRADAQGVVEGWVLEASTKPSGRVATVLVRRGTLKPGVIIVAGNSWARVRTLRDEAGRSLTEVGPGMPVEVDGWRDQPNAGDEVLEAPSEQKATSVVEYRLEREERLKIAKDMDAINDARRLEQERRAKEREANGVVADGEEQASTEETEDRQEQSQGQIVVPFIVKADVSGSAEAVAAYIMSVATPMITPQILSSQVGKVNESDIDLASTAKGYIIAFNLPADEPMNARAEANGVRVLENNIIYRVVEDVSTLLEDKLPPKITQRVLGEAEIGAVFDIKLTGRKTMKIAGCKVRNGVVTNHARVRVLRGTKKIYDGTITSLKNVKKDVQEMRKGTECGMAFDEWQKFEVGDQVQTYEEVSEKRKLYG